jgi:kynurenine formamidase
MKGSFFILFIAITVSSCSSPEIRPVTLEQVISTGKWIDLTYDFSKETVYWPNNPTGFELDTQFNGITPAGFFYASNSFCSPEHGGTHIDAPVHFSKGKLTVDQLAVDQLTGEAVVIDVSAKAADNRDYQASVGDVQEWEKTNGEIPANAILLIRTGWGKHYGDVSKYLGTAEKGNDAVAKLHFPGMHPDVATWLVKNRKIKALGIDTPSIDYGQSKDFKTHQLLYIENIPGFENIANMEQLPAKGAYIVALPMKIKDGSGGPLRIVAWVGNDKR